MDKEDLLVEVDDILRTMPSRSTLRHSEDQNFAWLGRVAAFVEIWNPSKSIPLNFAMNEFHGLNAREAQEGFRKILTLLHQSRQDLRMNTVGPMNSALGHGQVFDYFDEVRKIIEPASYDLFFIDPFLDAEFVSRYLSHTQKGTAIRLLGRERIATLLPAADLFSKQNDIQVSVRTAVGFHDRYVIVDGSACYQSGASFKDGAKAAPTTLTQITDAFDAVKKTYEDLWAKGKIER